MPPPSDRNPFGWKYNTVILSIDLYYPACHTQAAMTQYRSKVTEDQWTLMMTSLQSVQWQCDMAHWTVFYSFSNLSKAQSSSASNQVILNKARKNTHTHTKGMGLCLFMCVQLFCFSLLLSQTGNSSLHTVAQSQGHMYADTSCLKGVSRDRDFRCFWILLFAFIQIQFIPLCSWIV